ncbi:hypothetical protein HL653_11735 [Sphingomonas sp. AP4-R1]|uniref:hypothetical protein n=1 Tax=Sphingomonas sp. AP4-R1 TaxID=2735134 RepID=UPI0014934291|nr:hypothetical protein [Sphingomonas sp. AP4-R1]QJU58358.1 hypothetical protein HL653_11735 [Sphingomonas sp. AP4-R1]
MHSVFVALSTHIIFIVLLGTILTWAAYSSVAIVLLAMRLSPHGVRDIPAGIALALGTNLGTAIIRVLKGEARNAPDGRLRLGNPRGTVSKLGAATFVSAIVPIPR